MLPVGVQEDFLRALTKPREGAKDILLPARGTEPAALTGIASLVFTTNGTSYNGDIKNGIRHGRGTLTMPDGTRYAGTFEDGAVQGVGTLSLPDGAEYRGDMEQGKRHGRGTFTYPGNTSQYAGDWVHGKREGQGTLFFGPDRSAYYRGSWAADQRSGRGLQRYPSGNIYAGEWVADVKAGLGRMVWLDKLEEYTGAWRDDQPHGYGVHTWYTPPPSPSALSPAGLPSPTASGAELASSGGNGWTAGSEPGEAPFAGLGVANRYRGNFVNGRRHGFGVFEYSNGPKYAGYWWNGFKHGYGVYVAADGSTFDGMFYMDSAVASAKGSLEASASAGSATASAASGGPPVSPPSSGGAPLGSMALFTLYIQDLLPSDADMLSWFAAKFPLRLEEAEGAHAGQLAHKLAVQALQALDNTLLRWNGKLTAWYAAYASLSMGGVVGVGAAGRAPPSHNAVVADPACLAEYAHSLVISQEAGNANATTPTLRRAQLWRFVLDCGLLAPPLVTLATVDELLLTVRMKQARNVLDATTRLVQLAAQVEAAAAAEAAAKAAAEAAAARAAASSRASSRGSRGSRSRRGGAQEAAYEQEEKKGEYDHSPSSSPGRDAHTDSKEASSAAAAATATGATSTQSSEFGSAAGTIAAVARAELTSLRHAINAAHDPATPILFRDFVHVLVRLAHLRYTATGSTVPLWAQSGTSTPPQQSVLGSPLASASAAASSSASATGAGRRNSFGGSSVAPGPQRRASISGTVATAADDAHTVKSAFPLGGADGGGSASASVFSGTSAVGRSAGSTTAAGVMKAKNYGRIHKATTGTAANSSSATNVAPIATADPGSPEELSVAVENALYYIVQPRALTPAALLPSARDEGRSSNAKGARVSIESPTFSHVRSKLSTQPAASVSSTVSSAASIASAMPEAALPQPPLVPGDAVRAAVLPAAAVEPAAAASPAAAQAMASALSAALAALYAAFPQPQAELPADIRAAATLIPSATTSNSEGGEASGADRELDRDDPDADLIPAPLRAAVEGQYAGTITLRTLLTALTHPDAGIIPAPPAPAAAVSSRVQISSEAPADEAPSATAAAAAAPGTTTPAGKAGSASATASAKASRRPSVAATPGSATGSGGAGGGAGSGSTKVEAAQALAQNHAALASFTLDCEAAVASPTIPTFTHDMLLLALLPSVLLPPVASGSGVVGATTATAAASTTLVLSTLPDTGALAVRYEHQPESEALPLSAVLDTPCVPCQVSEALCRVSTAVVAFALHRQQLVQGLKEGLADKAREYLTVIEGEARAHFAHKHAPAPAPAPTATPARKSGGGSAAAAAILPARDVDDPGWDIDAVKAADEAADAELGARLRAAAAQLDAITASGPVATNPAPPAPPAPAAAAAAAAADGAEAAPAPAPAPAKPVPVVEMTPQLRDPKNTAAHVAAVLPVIISQAVLPH